MNGQESSCTYTQWNITHRWNKRIVVRDCSFSLSAHWSPLSVPTILPGFLLSWRNLGYPLLRVSLHSSSSKAQPVLLILDEGYLVTATPPGLEHTFPNGPWNLLKEIIHIFFFPCIFISWRLITLQFCSGFCHTLTWISHGVTCVPHPDPPSHLPLYPIPLGLPSAPGPTTCWKR